MARQRALPLTSRDSTSLCNVPYRTRGEGGSLVPWYLREAPVLKLVTRVTSMMELLRQQLTHGWRGPIRH